MSDREIDCPRCHANCGWCGDYRWMHRTLRLPGLPKQKCGIKDFEPEGDACPLCNGRRRVICRTTYSPIRAGRFPEQEGAFMADENASTFGQRAVGLTFNPSGDDAVHNCKIGFAAQIDQMNDYRNAPTTTPEAKRLASIAITELQGAQMWAVKALTWRD